MTLPRSSGILLHPTSLPGRFGCGDVGPEAHRFLDFLAQTGQRWWQVLPLGPTGYGDSPYQSFSTFAGNPLLISPERLVDDGLLSAADLQEIPPFPMGRVDYGPVISFKLALLKKSFERFESGARPAVKREFEGFCSANSVWLQDYALFMALKEAHGGAPWPTWEPDIAQREPESLERWRGTVNEAIRRHQYFQFQFFRQWSMLKWAAAGRGIRFIGDIPIFVAHDSADVWAHPELFFLDGAGQPTVVAGVPPDYYSETGQLWGNPLYRWDILKQTGYVWWLERIRAGLKTVDCIRLDHFRGFEGYWEIPAGETTAINGRWVKGPGADLFHALRYALKVHSLPLIAEDLGVITAEVNALRDQFSLSGMKVLQFAFTGGVAKMDAPYQYLRNCAVYTGTHDNDTSVGWLRNSSEPEEREAALRYMGKKDTSDFHWDFIRLAFSSVSDLAIVPAQDLLGLGPEARMNYPSRLGGNWAWRLQPGALTPEIAARLTELTEIYGRARTT